MPRHGQALVYTIRDASKTLCLSVMDFLPASAYSGGRGGVPVYWDALVSSILAVAYAKPVAVRLMVSHWAHTDATQVGAMARLAAGLVACRDAHQKCAGSLEVRQYYVPGWNATDGTWPAFTRVNHAKYIVSDRRCAAANSPSAANARDPRAPAERATRTVAPLVPPPFHLPFHLPAHLP